MPMGGRLSLSNCIETCLTKQLFLLGLFSELSFEQDLPDLFKDVHLDLVLSFVNDLGDQCRRYHKSVSGHDRFLRHSQRLVPSFNLASGPCLCRRSGSAFFASTTFVVAISCSVFHTFFILPFHCILSISCLFRPRIVFFRKFWASVSVCMTQALRFSSGTLQIWPYAQSSHDVYPVFIPCSPFLPSVLFVFNSPALVWVSAHRILLRDETYSPM